jgi:hypothetical protein
MKWSKKKFIWLIDYVVHDFKMKGFQLNWRAVFYHFNSCAGRSLTPKIRFSIISARKICCWKTFRECATEYHFFVFVFKYFLLLSALSDDIKIAIRHRQHNEQSREYIPRIGSDTGFVFCLFETHLQLTRTRLHYKCKFLPTTFCEIR